MDVEDPTLISRQGPRSELAEIARKNNEFDAMG
jgi:hypothetical protein